jgi:hypothetical protein
MRRNLLVTLGIPALLAAFGTSTAWALNPIHHASYSLVPRGKYASSAVLSVGGAVDSRRDDMFLVPFSFSLEAGKRVELGAGLKTQWGSGADDHIPYMAFGAKYLLSGATTLQGDLLLGVNVGSGKGFSIGLHHKEGHGSRLFSRFTGRLGFMEALVNEDALMALEAGWYPTLSIVRPLSLECGLIASSQTTDFNDYFALDLKPALQVHIGGESMVETGIFLGLAGEHREEMRVQVTVVKGF